MTSLEERLVIGRPAETTRTTLASSTAFLRRVLLSENFVLYLSITYFIILSIFIPSLAEPRNLSNQLSNVWPLLAVAVGQTFVLIIAGIDLSQGSIMAVTSVVGGIIMTSAVDPLLFENSPLWGTLLHENGGLLAGHNLAVPIAVIAMLLVGAFVGGLNGIAITRFDMPPFMVTLVSLIFFSAFAIYLTQSQNISNLPDSFLQLGEGDIVSVYFGEKAEPEIKRRDILPLVSYPLVISVGLAVAGQFILRRTVFGRYIYAIGTNRKAAQISGVPTQRVITLVYMFSGVCAAVAAILYSARLQGGRPTTGGGNLLLDIIGATVIGGTSLAGGKGKVSWTFFGVVFFVLLLNTLNSMGLSAFHIDAVKGIIILIAALLDVTRTRLLARERLA
ncbi:MAG: ABC transporter permease [Burkholderiales bacterium]|nr:ABC transporter permease [Anaerolineae bacterium]